MLSRFHQQKVSINPGKMFPVIEGVYTIVNLNPENDDTEELKKYKDLLNKEYSFCLKIVDDVIRKANKLYSKQMSTGKILKYCCDFKALEIASSTYFENSYKKGVDLCSEAKHWTG